MKSSKIRRFVIAGMTVLCIILGIGFLSPSPVSAQRHWLDEDWNWDEDWHGGDRTSALVRYNRVEGLLLGVKMNRDYWRQRRPLSAILFGQLGYALSAKELEYQIGLEQGFSQASRLGLGAEYHRFIDTPDNWFINESENYLAAFLLKEDFHDYYLREGGSVYLNQEIGDYIELDFGYHFEQFDSVEKNTNWALFGGKKDFPENPAMAAGELRSLRGGVVFDTRSDLRRTPNGLYLQLDYEHAGDNMGGDFTFDRFLIDLRRYLTFGFDQGVDIRLLVGTSHGLLPWQRSYQLGGIGTLRGYGYKEISGGRMTPGGNRMILGQLEYRMGEGNLPHWIDLGLFELFNLMIFADAGWVGNAPVDTGLLKGFDGLEWGVFKSDVGLALANRSGSVRFEVARRTDRSDKPFRFFFRVRRTF